MSKKNIVDALIERELSTLDDICEVLEKLKIVKKPDWKDYLTESDARMWYEANPTTGEKKQVLTALGYDFSEFNKNKKFKYENISPNDKGSFENRYKNSLRLITHLKSELQQLAAAHKCYEENKDNAVADTLPRFPNINVKLSN